nr:hypothetical protein [uncultured Mediterranean phage uvMED]BAR25745.1 hypothetical protein [uncultured Mediterranean phage uvMED]
MCGGGDGPATIADTAAQKKLAELAAKRFNLYQQYFVPLENQYISDIFNLGDSATFESVDAFVNAIQQPEYQATRKGIEAEAFARGMDPTSGQYRGAVSNVLTSSGRGGALGAAEALSGQVDRKYQGMQNLIQMGQGQSGKAIAGLGDVATLALERAKSEGKTAAADYLGKQQLVGTAVGTGLGLFMAGDGFG